MLCSIACCQMRKNIYALLATVGFLLISEPALAIVVFGGSDCGQWVNQQSEFRKTWLLGFLSGLNSGVVGTAGIKGDPLDKLNSADQAYVWMDNYCRANPLKKVSDGAHTLYRELNK